MTRQEASLEFVAFCLQAAPGVGAATLRKVLARLKSEGLSSADFLRLKDEVLSQRFGLKPPACAAIRAPSAETLDIWRRLLTRSVEVLVYGQAGYPKRLQSLLRDSSPPILYLLGRLDLFDYPAVGFCGSRRASEKGLRVAHECASLLAQEHINVISGYAQGVDVAAHRAALESGGTTTIVLAEGILNFHLKAEIREILTVGDYSHLSVVSEFPPGLSWRAHNAMVRNRTICGLANAMVVIESGSSGGTFEAGRAALELGEPLFCVDYAEIPAAAAGNPYFLEKGAFRLRRAKTGEPNLARLISVVRDSPPMLRPSLQNNSLF